MVHSTTQGERAFLRFLTGDNPTGRPITVRAAALALGVSPAMICRYRDGRDSPPPAMRAAIYRWTGGKIRRSWWRTEREQEAWLRARMVQPLQAAA